jgi:hypothetical protein
VDGCSLGPLIASQSSKEQGAICEAKLSSGQPERHACFEEHIAGVYPSPPSPSTRPALPVVTTRRTRRLMSVYQNDDCALPRLVGCTSVAYSHVGSVRRSSRHWSACPHFSWKRVSTCVLNQPCNHTRRVGQGVRERGVVGRRVLEPAHGQGLV